MILLFCPSIFQFLASLAGTLPSSRTWMRFCADLLLLAAVHQFQSHSLPRIPRAFPAPNEDLSVSISSCYQIMTSKVTLSPFSKIFDMYLGPVHFPGSSTPHASTLAGFSTTLRSMPRLLSFLIHTMPLFFWLWPCLLTVFPFNH